MADYYPLIARAIAGLDPSAPGESRRALYERARAALIAQLRSVQPPLSESEITRERLSLEEAVRKVESEAAQRARDALAPGGARPAAPRPRRRCVPRQYPSQCAAGRNRRHRLPRSRPRRRRRVRARLRRHRRATTVRRSAGRPRRAAQSSRRCRTPPARGRSSRRSRCRIRSCRRPANAQARRAAAPTTAPPQAPGVRGFRDIAADADDLGRAAAQASRSARKTYANVPSPSPEFDRLEPSMENRGADPDAPYSYDESVEEAERYAPPPQQPGAARSRVAADREPKKRARTGAVFPFKSAIAVGVVLILVGAAILWGKSGGDDRQRPVQVRRPVVEAPKDAFGAAVEAEDSRSRRPAVVVRAGRAGGAARGAV